MRVQNGSRLFVDAIPGALAVVLVAVSCARSGGAPSAAGTWRAVLESPGGELPFGLRIEEVAEAGKTVRLTAVALNGDEVLPFETARADGDRVLLRFDHYDSEIAARLSPDGGTMIGTWVKQAGRDRPSMPFHATRGAAPRFTPDAASAGAAPAAGPDSITGTITGTWEAAFTDDEGTSPAVGEFRLEGERLLGTFLTPTGDYRFLEGDYRGGRLRLSCFDGGHAFLFHAALDATGALKGDFWSRGSYHATWTAHRATGPTALPDPFVVTTLKNPTGHLAFAFPDLDGRTVSLADERFKGKVVLVDVFGSWCPNCNDEAPVLAEMYRLYHDRGLEIVGLAYEMTGDPSRDAVYVRKYAERHGIAWPLLLAGTSDKAEASLTLPDLSGVLAFPTLIFIGRDGKVAAIHTGFEGPGTGRHFDDLKSRFTTQIERLL